MSALLHKVLNKMPVQIKSLGHMTLNNWQDLNSYGSIHTPILTGFESTVLNGLNYASVNEWK